MSFWQFGSVSWEIDEQTSAITNSDKHYIEAIGSDARQALSLWILQGQELLCHTNHPLVDETGRAGMVSPTLQN